MSAGNGQCQAELKVEHEHTNPMGGLHGGFSATLVDIISSCALLTHKKGEAPSVSVDMNLTWVICYKLLSNFLTKNLYFFCFRYLKGAQIGDEIVIDAKTLKAGKNVAFLEVEIKEKTTGALLVKGAHTKYLLH